MNKNLRKDFWDCLGGKALVRISQWYPMATINQSFSYIAPQSIPEIFATEACLHSLSTDIFQCDGCLFVFFCVGAHGWVVLLCQLWGHYFNLGAGCQTWKPLDTPGTQPPVSNAVVNGVENKNYTKCVKLSCFLNTD